MGFLFFGRKYNRKTFEKNTALFRERVEAMLEGCHDLPGAGSALNRVLSELEEQSYPEPMNAEQMKALDRRIAEHLAKMETDLREGGYGRFPARAGLVVDELQNSRRFGVDRKNAPDITGEELTVQLLGQLGEAIRRHEIREANELVLVLESHIGALYRTELCAAQDLLAEAKDPDRFALLAFGLCNAQDRRSFFGAPNSDIEDKDRLSGVICDCDPVAEFDRRVKLLNNGESAPAATATVACKHCGFTNEENSRYCKRCGEKLPDDREE